jgi:ubiquinone/menaquinone biosynthesis C-methylase UbiE
VNAAHNVLCASRRWQRRVERKLVPWGLEGVELGPRVLEVGPGFGATTHVLVKRLGRLDVLELDKRYCQRLQVQLGRRVQVTQGDATSMPYPDGEFSAVICFTMLHHIPTRELQDRAFAEVARVLAPGGVFAGTDSLGGSLTFKLIHIGDTLNLIDPNELPARLAGAGLADAEVEREERSFRFRARRPKGAQKPAGPARSRA